MGLLLALQFALHDEAARVIGERTRLEAYDVLPLVGRRMLVVSGEITRFAKTS